MSIVLVGGTTPIPLEPRTVLRIGAQYLVETADEPNEWYLGERDADGRIACWGRYGALEVALRSL